MLRDISFSFVKAVVGNQAYCSLIVDLTQMYSDCVKACALPKIMTSQLQILLPTQLLVNENAHII